jgi:hypothetical protein
MSDGGRSFSLTRLGRASLFALPSRGRGQRQAPGEREAAHSGGQS